ncbi:iron complex transport system permease protein [Desulfobacula phenolica]|uniref:Iron complex transport system permease protein n=1 Tax=Desulfobacula phenolica TaxID=90732 RepID=A0A1H2K445_9BACT|nr:iron complex transport system permease protein [Desulfobacula phenolica]
MITVSSLNQNRSILFKLLSSNKKIVLILIFLGILVLTSLFAITCGNFNIEFSDIFSVIAANISPFTDIESVNRLHNTIIWKIRLPRIILAINVGIALSISGAVFQGCFKNPLVEPYILGISSGAAFGAALGILFPSFFLSVQALAFCFAFIAVAAAYFLAHTRGETPIIMLILAGIIIGSIFSAFVGIIKYLAQDSALREIVFWLMGGFYYANWDDVILISPIIFVSFSIIWLHSWKLNILSMGDDEAKALGVSPEKFKFLFIILATLSTAVAVSCVGIIAWVGLMMPHATRMVMGPDHRFLIPVSAIFGAIYLIICDTIARTLVNAEIPIGIITSILGAPYLFYLIRSRGASAFGG